MAAQRKTGLKAMVAHALRREIAPKEGLTPDGLYEAGPFGSLSLRKRTEALPGMTRSYVCLSAVR